MTWIEFEEATVPKDRPIIICYNNGVNWEWKVVEHNGGFEDYDWSYHKFGETNCIPSSRIHYWLDIKYPYNPEEEVFTYL